MERARARMQLFERCAALLLAELDARESGDRLVADAMHAERDALRSAWEALGAAPADGATFADALDGATLELSHREAVDQVVRERLAALGAAAARQLAPAGRRRTTAGPRHGPGLLEPPPQAHALDLTT